MAIMAHYYEVIACTPTFHGKQALTYRSDKKLEPGSLVQVPLKQATVTAIVISQTTKPAFVTKAISGIVVEKPLPTSCITLMEWLRIYYPAPLGILAQLFAPPTLNKSEATANNEKVIAAPKPKKLPSLTPEQKNTVSTIVKSTTRTFLIHGDTGTGKTRVYLELAQKSLKNGKHVLVLTPEIGLTPQLAQTFEKAFPGQVVVAHSQLSPAERRKIWYKILLATEPIIVVGPRSVLFSPLGNIGLIVVDECHEGAYKQEQAPYYQSIRVAATLAGIHKATLLLGSATPPVSEYYYAKAKKIPILRLRKPAVQQHLKPAQISIINLRDSTLFTRRSHLADALLDTIAGALERKEQAMVFLNRRGTARSIVCQNCGWQAICPYCDIPLTYHSDVHTIRCHTCGYQADMPSSCPQCHSVDILLKSIGTKQLFEELGRAFPHARIKRFDTDSKKSERLEQHYHDIAKGSIDIIVGTQLITKGLDLPRLGVVGVVLADTSLYFPDYTAEERTFQLLTQIIGRVGRGHLPGKVFIQSYTPEKSVFKAAVAKDWSTFYQEQIKQRQIFKYPPFCHMLKVTCVRSSSKSAALAMQKLLELLQAKHYRVEYVGPSPSFFERIRGKYQWQLVVKAKQRSELTKIVVQLPANYSYDLDPIDLL